MKRAILAAFAALLLIASPVLAAPPGNADPATITVVSIVADCPHPELSDRGCITFQTEPSKGGGPHRHVIEVAIYAPWACSYRPTGQWACASEIGTIELDRDGVGVYYYRNGTLSSGEPYGETYSAYVTLWGDRNTPISPIVTGTLP